MCALNFPGLGQSGPGQDHRHAHEAGFPARRPEPHSPDGTRAGPALAARCSSSATNTRPSPPWARTIRRGDEKFFALSRQAKCIPIVATQSISSLRSTLPGESWRTLLQTFRTKIFLALSDDFSAKTRQRALRQRGAAQAQLQLLGKRAGRRRERAHRPGRRAQGHARAPARATTSSATSSLSRRFSRN